MTKLEQELERVKRIAALNKPEAFTDVMERLTGKPYRALTQATPYEEVKSQYTLPFGAFPFQEEIINRLAYEPKSGLYMDTGTGKTYTSIVIALFKMGMQVVDKTVVLMPPILLDGWSRFLQRFAPVSVQIYRGTPAQRKKIALGEADFTLAGIQIFKRDFERFSKVFADHRTIVAYDEATGIKNVSSDNYRKFTSFTADKEVMLLTGTPLSTPEDGYAYVKIIAPSIYRNKAQFMNIHADERDFFNQVVSWKNLDLLAENMKVNSARVLKQDVLEHLPEVTYDPLFYRLEPGHAALYCELAEQQLLELKDGGKIDATSVGKLRHALGQIICNYEHFSGDPQKRSTCLDLLDQTFESLGPDKKLVIFANYRMTNRRLLQYLLRYNAVAAFGDQSVTQNQASVDRFVQDPSCRAFVAQPTSAGYGVDGLQEVCHDGIFLEIPSVRDFNQAVARLHRSGQKDGVHIRIAVAEGTLQVRDQQRLLANDELVNKVVRNYQDLRQAIFGA